MKTTGYAFQQTDSLVVGNGFVEATITLDGSPHLASLTNKLTGTMFRFRNNEDCVLRLASGSVCLGSGSLIRERPAVENIRNRPLSANSSV